jgi:hypothetical protein
MLTTETPVARASQGHTRLLLMLAGNLGMRFADFLLIVNLIVTK